MEERVKVLIVDDHELVRDGLKTLLGRDRRLHVVGEAVNGADALAQLPVARPDVVLMDLVMPEMDGAEATARIRDAHPNVRVVVLSGAGDRALTEKALAAGASSYLAKDSRHEAVAEAIHSAAGDRRPTDGYAFPPIPQALAPGLGPVTGDENDAPGLDEA